MQRFSSETKDRLKGKEVTIKSFEATSSSQDEDYTMEESRYPTRMRKPFREW